MIRTRFLAAGVGLLVLTVLPGSASAQSQTPPPPPKCVLDCPKPAPQVSGGQGVIAVAATYGSSDAVPGRGDSSYGEAPGRAEWKTVEEYITPMCDGNGLHGADSLCAAAISTCPADNLIRFWVWHRVTEHKMGPPQTSVAGDWVMEPGTYCLGADDPGVPDIARAIAQVQSIFLELALPVFDIDVRPQPQTLVNIPTAFSAGTAEQEVFDVAPLGIRMRITATPSTWLWHFGDGSDSQETSSPGGPGSPAVRHTYSQARPAAATVLVTWRGTFTLLDTGETFPIRTPAYVQGAPATVDVREARTELVRD